MMSDVRIQQMEVLNGVASKLDLGNYRHSRLQLQSDGGLLAIALDEQSAENPTGGSAYILLPGESMQGVASPTLNLDGLSGVFWVAGTGGANAVFTVMQWGGVDGY